MVTTTVCWLKDRHFVGMDSNNHFSQEKYCSVAATVRGVARITYDYEIVTELFRN